MVCGMVAPVVPGVLLAGEHPGAQPTMGRDRHRLRAGGAGQGGKDLVGGGALPGIALHQRADQPDQVRGDPGERRER